MTEHTPAPWIMVEDEDQHGIPCWHIMFDHCTVRSLIATVFGHRVPIAKGVNKTPGSKENARLIAAAPETAAERDRLREINAKLLEALTNISEGVGAFSMDPVTHAENCIREMRLTASAAITKATGGAA